jgi:hypothetical protein
VDVKGTQTPFRITTTNPPSSVWIDPQREVLRSTSELPAGPNLLRLHTAEGPLLVVYATGSAAEAPRLKAAAGLVRSVVPAARIRIKPDRSVTAKELAAGNVLLIGKPQHLRIPAAYTSKLPFRYTDTAITDTRSNVVTRGTDLWGISIQSHPSNPRRFIAQAASTSPKAIRGIQYQDGLTPTDSRFIATASGRLVAARRDTADPGEVAYVSP